MNMFKTIKEYYKENNKKTLTIYIILRLLVILSLVLQIFRGNWNNAFLCFSTLVLFTIPYFLDKKFKIALPNVLETIILLFIFSAQILGEIQNFYGTFKHWDTMLHTLNGFLCAAIGFSLIDILNRNLELYTLLNINSIQYLVINKSLYSCPLFHLLHKLEKSTIHISLLFVD